MMKDDGPVVEALGLKKKLGNTVAVNDLSFEVEAGSVFGLLGLNGSGKTTTIRLLLGLLAPDAGRSSVFGEDSLTLSRPTRRRIGYLSEKPFPLDDLPLPYLLRYQSAFFDRWDWARVEDLVRRLEVPQDRTLNGGSMRERSGRRCGSRQATSGKVFRGPVDGPASKRLHFIARPVRGPSLGVEST